MGLEKTAHHRPTDSLITGYPALYIDHSCILCLLPSLTDPNFSRNVRR